MAMTPRGEGRKGRKAMRVLCIGAVALARGLQSAGAAPSAAPSLLRGGLEWSGSGLGSSHTSGVPSTSGRGADVPLAAAEAPGEMAAALRTMFPHSVECPAPWAAPACAARHRELAEFTHRLSQCSAPAQRTERVLAVSPPPPAAPLSPPAPPPAPAGARPREKKPPRRVRGPRGPSDATSWNLGASGS